MSSWFVHKTRRTPATLHQAGIFMYGACICAIQANTQEEPGK